MLNLRWRLRAALPSCRIPGLSIAYAWIARAHGLITPARTAVTRSVPLVRTCAIGRSGSHGASLACET